MIKEILLKLPLFALVVLIISCDKQTPNQSDKVVVEAFLYAGETVDDVNLAKLLAYGGEDTIPKPINDAEVTITWNNKTFDLTNSSDTGSYHYPFTDLKIEEGQVYQLKVTHAGFEITALTICPPKPSFPSASKDTLTIELFSVIDSFLTGGNTEIPDPDSVVIEWANPNNDYYFVVAENVEPTKEDIYPPIFGLIGDFFFQTSPTQASRYVFTDLDFRHFGRHEIRIYKVNQEYVDLYQSYEQDSRTQAEPITNVINGLGIFTAVNYRTVNLFVTK
jgi:hypothetical protein